MLGSALDELGQPWRALTVEEFDPTKLKNVCMVAADGATMMDRIAVLQPLLNAKLVEIVQRGRDPMSHEWLILHVPLDSSELQALLE